MEMVKSNWNVFITVCHHSTRLVIFLIPPLHLHVCCILILSIMLFSGDESYAFYTHNVTDISPSVGDTLMFDTVQYNEAGVYSITTGRYTAPIDGIYRFDATLCTKTLRQLSAEFYMEGSVDQQIGIVKSSSTCSSDHAIAELAAGDEVFLRVIDKSGIGNLIQRDDERRNSFTGHYLGPLPTMD